MHEILSLLGLFAAFVVCFAVAFAIVIGLPLYGICGFLRFLTRKGI